MTEIGKNDASTLAWNLRCVVKQDTPTSPSIAAALTLPSRAKQVIDAPPVQQSNGAIDLALDYETGLLITSSKSTVNLPATAANNHTTTGG